MTKLNYYPVSFWVQESRQIEVPFDKANSQEEAEELMQKEFDDKGYDGFIKDMEVVFREMELIPFNEAEELKEEQLELPLGEEEV